MREERVWLGKEQKTEKKKCLVGKETERIEVGSLQSPSLHPLALSSHQRHQGGPNEVKTTSTSFNLTYLHLFLSSYSESSEEKKKGKR